jgi:hypothetical protein
MQQIWHRNLGWAMAFACIRSAAAARYDFVAGGDEMELRAVIRAISTVSLIAGMATLARAETNLITQAGAWQAFGGTTTGGRPLCGVSQSSNNHYFGLKYYAGDPTFTIQVGAKTWRLETGAKQSLQMIMDGHAPWNVTAAGMHFNDGDAGLQFSINRAEIDQFAAEFRGSGQLRLRFTDPDAAEWSLSLAGSNAVTDAFLQCITGLR